ncbi:hypothetical protein B0H13DRAFT_2331282 [Mycena leptocephala]|nr:hypothetical protein B0H13DRAFT_2331282 [Mycena leptocephala]
MALIQTLLLIATIWIARWLWRSASFVTGNMKEVFNPNAWDYHQVGVFSFDFEWNWNMRLPSSGTCEKYDGGVIRINGLLGEQQLYIFDPKSLHQILVKDQDIFEEPSYVIKGTRVSFGEGLLSTLGEKHKKSEKCSILCFPPPTSGKWSPFFLMWERGSEMRWNLGYKTDHKRELKRGVPQIDLLLWMTRTALELVGQAGIGYSFDTLLTDEVPLYILSAKKMQ